MLITQKWISIEDDGHVRWTGGNCDLLRFGDIRTLARSRTLIFYRDTLLLWLFPVQLLNAFADVYVLTYMFACSHLRYYLDVHQIGYTMEHSFTLDST